MEPIDDMTPAIAAELRAERARLNVSGRELAARMGRSPASIARLLSGSRQLTLVDMYAFANALGIDPMTLVERINRAVTDGEH